MKVWLFLFAILYSISGSAQSEFCPILPSPSSFVQLEGQIRLTDTLLVNTGTLESTSKNYLQDRLQSLFGISLKESTVSEAIQFQKREINEFTYSILISEAEKNISYSDNESAFHAINSFIQLIQTDQQGSFIDCVMIMDQPKFEWRGMHLDVSRHFYSVEEVKRYIDLLALYKFNKFHWHLTDDQGWRIEIKKYPKLTEIGGFRDSTVIGHYNDSPRKYEHKRYGGFYTQEEIKEVVKYAAERFITVVPEIELPGHSRAAIAAYPFLSCTGEELPVPGLWGIFDDIYCSKDTTIQFMKDVLAEVVELFPSKYIHIGGDEAPKTRWKACPQCQANIKKNQLKDEHELQSYFIRQIDEFLASKGKKLIGWDEILEGGLSPGMTIMSWRGTEGGIEAADQGHPVVMSPTSHCYFDYYQSGHSSEPLAIGGFLPLEKVYEFNPIAKEMTSEQAKFVLGGQANMWTEYIASMDHLEYMMFPRAIAMAQNLWSTVKPNYDSFLAIYTKYHEKFLDRNKVNYSKSIHYPELRISRAENGIYTQFSSGISYGPLNIFESVKSGQMSFKNAFIYSPDDSLFIERARNQNEVKEIRYNVTSEKMTEPVSFTILAHESLGLPIDLVTKPHPKYTNSGSLTLVDGIIAGDPWKGNEWLGFQEKKVEFIVDLTELRKVNGAKIGLLDKNGSWIYLPEKAKLSGSKNRKCWKKISTSEFSGEWDGRTLNLSGKTRQIRYVKVELEAMDVIPDGKDGAGNIPWTFIDEIQISFDEQDEN